MQYREKVLALDDQLSKLGGSLNDVTLVAVTKKQSAAVINEYLKQFPTQFGVPHIGENYIQEFAEKREDLTLPCIKHFIGSFQSNKAALVAKFDWIHGLGSKKHLAIIHKCGLDILSRGLLQVNVSNEPSKSGVHVNQVAELAGECAGLMCIGSDSLAKAKDEFMLMAKLRDELQDRFNRKFVLSMGMSGDYLEAVRCGSDMIRIGSYIFGERG